MNGRKYFSLDARGIVPPAARGAKQNGNRRSRVDITLYGVIRERCGVRGAIVTGVVRLGSGAHSWSLRTFFLFLLSFPLKVRIEMAIGSEDLRESRFRRSWVYVVEVGLPRISARGYIVISQVKI